MRAVRVETKGVYVSSLLKISSLNKVRPKCANNVFYYKSSNNGWCIINIRFRSLQILYTTGRARILVWGEDKNKELKAKLISIF